MVTRPKHGEEYLPDLESIDKLYDELEKIKSDYEDQPEKIKTAEEAIVKEIERVRNNSLSLESIEKALHDILKDGVKSILISKRIEESLNIQRVAIYDKDVSKIHGQLDIWIKAIGTKNVDNVSTAIPPPGSVYLSRSLSEKLSQKISSNTEETVIYMGRWSDKEAVYPFKVYGIIATGSLNCIYMNLADLNTLGYTEGFNVIGLNLINASFSEIQKIKELLLDRWGKKLRVQTVYGGATVSQMQLFLLPALWVLILFMIIMIVNYYFVVIHNYEGRKTEFYLLSLYNYGKLRKLLTYTLLNMAPGLFGFAISILLIIINFPISLQSILPKYGGSLAVKLTRFKLFLDPFSNPLAYGVLLFFIVFFFVISFSYLYKKKLDS